MTPEIDACNACKWKFKFGSCHAVSAVEAAKRLPNASAALEAINNSFKSACPKLPELVKENGKREKDD